MANSQKASQMRPERHCQVCGEPFRARRSQRFCSAKCRRASWSATNPLGLTLRQWYAGMAMQGEMIREKFVGYYHKYDVLAERCFSIADAMIAHERKNK